MDSGVYPEHLVDQMNSQKQIMDQFYNNDKLTPPTGKEVYNYHLLAELNFIDIIRGIA